MSAAIKCPVTGELSEGAGVSNVDVDISENLRVRAIVFVKKAKDSYAQENIGPVAAAKIAKALEALKTK